MLTLETEGYIVFNIDVTDRLDDAVDIEYEPEYVSIVNVLVNVLTSKTLTKLPNYTVYYVDPEQDVQKSEIVTDERTLELLELLQVFVTVVEVVS